MKLNDDQQARIARLLVNFSSHTANRVLNRFDKKTRSKVQTIMSDLAINGPAKDAASLADFAEFLYFDPEQDPNPASPPGHQTSSDRPILKPNGMPASRVVNSNGVSNGKSLSFHDVIAFSDLSLDSLLKAAPPELTVSILRCSPKTFIHRVLTRLSPDEAESVRQQINIGGTISIQTMQQIHQRYCDFATQLIDNGLIDQ